mmetsp:Transcript_39193/g.54415  ORF Transcript_39193/g.54415 Transcript_39193/m.54415 type:complete len:185 (+) Transcript_39193:336-890(+)
MIFPHWILFHPSFFWFMEWLDNSTTLAEPTATFKECTICFQNITVDNRLESNEFLCHPKHFCLRCMQRLQFDALCFSEAPVVKCPLFVAITKCKNLLRRRRIVEILIKYGVDQKVTDPKGNSILHMAAECKDPMLLDVLLRSKDSPDINSRNDAGQTPLHLALENQNSLIELFINLHVSISRSK